MAAKQGFSLVEIIVVLVIVGIVAAGIIPPLIASMEQAKAQQAKNNLLAISAAQQKYFEDHGSYCLTNCGDSTAHINSYLYLSISDHFSYSCIAAGSLYSCTATDGTDTLTLTATAWGASVSCTIAPNSAYCPS